MEKHFKKIDVDHEEGEAIPLEPLTELAHHKKAGRPKKVSEEKESSVKKTKKSKDKLSEDISIIESPLEASTGVTVAAFMLDDENASTAKEFGSGGTNTEEVRKEILKAIQEEGDNF